MIVPVLVAAALIWLLPAVGFTLLSRRSGWDYRWMAGAVVWALFLGWPIAFQVLGTVLEL